MDSFDKWLIKEYYKILEPEKTREKVDKDFFNKTDKTFLRGLHGLLKLETIKHDIILQNYKCTVFRAKREDCITNYAYMYGNDYVCLSPTFNSCDGEYRHRFVTYNQIIVQAKKYDIFNIAEQFIMNEIMQKELDLTVISFDKDFNQNNLAVLFYISSWLVEYHYYLSDYTENHIVENYKKIMLVEKYKPLFNTIKKKLGKQFYQLIEFLTYISNDGITLEQLECGQKMIPLTKGDIVNTGDFRYSVWKELQVNRIVQDLRYNAITPSVPVMGSYFILQNNNQVMFDNKNMQNRIKHSNIAKEIVNDLGDSITDYISVSYKFEELAKRIEVPIKFARDQMIMSGSTMIMVMEHIGRTLSDIPKLIKSTSAKGYITPKIIQQLQISLKDLQASGYYDNYAVETYPVLSNSDNNVRQVNGGWLVRQVFITRYYYNPDDSLLKEEYSNANAKAEYTLEQDITFFVVQSPNSQGLALDSIVSSKDYKSKKGATNES